MTTDTLTLSLILTAAGATVSAGIITGLIAMLKNLPNIGPWIDAKNEPLVAFVLSAALVIYAVAATATVINAVTVFGGFLAWYGIATIAMGLHDNAITLRGPAA